MTGFIRACSLGLLLLGMIGCSADKSVVIPDNPTPPPPEAENTLSGTPPSE